MSGVSPTRPTRLLVRPPVEVAAARWPSRSSATAPTVPYLLSSGPAPAAAAAPRGHRDPAQPIAPRATRSCSQRRAVEKYDGSTIASPAAREGLGAGADEQDVRRRSITARAARPDGERGQPGHGAGAEVAAVHDRGIELERVVVREHRAPAGVEQRRVLEHPDGGGDGVEARSAGREHPLACEQRGGERRPVVGLELAGERGAGDRPGTPVDRNGEW